jgi:hypothetical protein
MIDFENRIYLSERNLRILLSKLERFRQGEETKCSIVKYSNPLDPYCQTMDEIMVIAIPDDKYYTTRQAGKMHPKDEANIG